MPNRSRSKRAPRDRPPAASPDDVGSPAAPRARFLSLDAYRVQREWDRYEGTAQRDLFRELRRRFLARHAPSAPWVLDAGSGPGRFTPDLGGPASRRVALDLSQEMLRRARRAGTEGTGAPSPGADLVRADLAAAPFGAGTFGEVALLGNALGFAGATGARLLAEAERLLGPGGQLLLEVAPGAGERSRYLARLPPGAVGRLLEAPPQAVVPRIAREGFARAPPRHHEAEFVRWSPASLLDRYRLAGWTVAEVGAVAPALGLDADRVRAVAEHPKAWGRLLEVEEIVGRSPARWDSAAAVLLAVTKPEGTPEPDARASRKG